MRTYIFPRKDTWVFIGVYAALMLATAATQYASAYPDFLFGYVWLIVFALIGLALSAWDGYRRGFSILWYVVTLVVFMSIELWIFHHFKGNYGYELYNAFSSAQYLAVPALCGNLLGGITHYRDKRRSDTAETDLTLGDSDDRSESLSTQTTHTAAFNLWTTPHKATYRWIGATAIAYYGAIALFIAYVATADRATGGIELILYMALMLISFIFPFWDGIRRGAHIVWAISFVVLMGLPVLLAFYEMRGWDTYMAVLLSIFTGLAIIGNLVGHVGYRIAQKNQ